jgi:hypothetical protein
LKRKSTISSPHSGQMTERYIADSPDWVSGRRPDIRTPREVLLNWTRL